MSNRGFSLMELITGLAIVSVLAVFAYPEVNDWNSGLTLNAETVNVVADLKRARNVAISRNAYVVFSYSDRGYLLFVDDGLGGGIKDDRVYQPGETILADCVLDPKVAILTGESTFTLARAVFSGSVGVKAGTIVLAGEKGKKNRIIMNAVGRVRVEKG